MSSVRIINSHVVSMSLEGNQLLKHHQYSVLINVIIYWLVFLGTYKVAIKCGKIKKLTVVSVLFCCVTNNIQSKTKWLWWILNMQNWCCTAIFRATSYWRHTNHLNEYHPERVDVPHYCDSKLVNRFTAVRSKVLTSLKEVSVHNITGTWGTWHYSPENPREIFHLYKSQIIKTLSEDDPDYCTEIPSLHIGCLSKRTVCYSGQN
jgi:hypothetical protein